MELKKQKEVSEAAEKIRRDKWIKEKTQEIKELTVKGLEPEIQRLITKHKAEIKAIKSANQVSILFLFIFYYCISYNRIKCRGLVPK